MTCVIGLVDVGHGTSAIGAEQKHDIYMGADSAGVGGYSLRIRADEKVFIKDDFIFGFTSSFRMGQLIRYKFNIPDRTENQSTDDYIHTTFLDNLIECLKINGYATIDKNEIRGGTFLFGYRGRLYEVEDNFQIAKYNKPYASVGCGSNIALGCMYGLNNKLISPEDMIRISLDAAVEFSAGVRGPYHILKLEA